MANQPLPYIEVATRVYQMHAYAAIIHNNFTMIIHHQSLKHAHASCSVLQLTVMYKTLN